MKKIILVALVAVLGYAGYYYWQNFRGALPAFTTPSQNITKLFKESQNKPFSPGKNQTEFPLTIPDGFTLSIFAENLGKARVLQLDVTGTLVVSDINDGKIVALPDKDTNGKADENTIVLQGLDTPH